MTIDAIDLLAEAKSIDPPAGLPRVDRHRGSYCAHRQTTIIEDQRRVDCVACKAQLDPFDVLLKLSRQWSTVASELKLLREDTDKARVALADLKRQEANARARVKRAGGATR